MKRIHSVGWFSSYDRGLDLLLAFWPKIREQVPDATLDIYYGWNIFDKMHSQNPKMMKVKWHMIKQLSDLKSQGVVEHGRVSHVELAKAMQEIKVWAYPTMFTEISCITAMKVLRAGIIPVTTGVAALSETLGSFGFNIKCDDIYTNEKKQIEFVNRVAEALLKDDYNPSLAQEFASRYYWPNVAQEWDKILS